MKIIADTSSLFSPEEGKRVGVTVIPVSVAIDGKSYKDYEEIQSEEFLELINAGATATSSQPAIGDVLDVFEEDSEEKLFLAIGDGLSGTYQSAVGAKNCLDDNEHIHVVDTKTLAGPLHYIVQKAVRLKENGRSISQIKEELANSIENSVSFVIPVDFEFLKRSGRLTPVAAKIGGLIKIVPVMTQTADRKRIEPFVIKRSRKKALEAISKHLESMGVNKDYIISISHGGVEEKAKEIAVQMKERFQDALVEVFCLPPALITHGGPGCIVIQAVKK